MCLGFAQKQTHINLNHRLRNIYKPFLDCNHFYFVRPVYSSILIPNLLQAR